MVLRWPFGWPASTQTLARVSRTLPRTLAATTQAVAAVLLRDCVSVVAAAPLGIADIRRITHPSEYHHLGSVITWTTF